MSASRERRYPEGSRLRVTELSRDVAEDPVGGMGAIEAGHFTAESLAWLALRRERLMMAGTRPLHVPRWERAGEAAGTKAREDRARTTEQEVRGQTDEARESRLKCCKINRLPAGIASLVPQQIRRQQLLPLVVERVVPRYEVPAQTDTGACASHLHKACTGSCLGHRINHCSVGPRRAPPRRWACHGPLGLNPLPKIGGPSF